MKKWTKRLSLSGGALAGILVILALTAWILLRGTPDWYVPSTLTAEQRDQLASNAESKLLQIGSQASFARANERAASGRRGRASTNSATNPSDLSVSFSDDELNALLEKWSVRSDIKKIYERFITEPLILLKDDRVILAGRVKQLGAVVSLQFQPSIGEDGELQMKLENVLAGRLPLPQGVISGYEKKATAGIDARMPEWKRQADFDPTGVANKQVIAATTAQQLLDLFKNSPMEPVLFLRLLDADKMIATKISQVQIDKHTLTLTVHPMTAAERGALLERVRAAADPAENVKR